MIRNSLTTHGHPNGFLGAAFHAMVLAFTLREGQLPDPHWVQEAFSELRLVTTIVDNDDDLQDFWLRKREAETNRTLGGAVDETIREMRELLKRALAVEAGEPPHMYGRVADALALRDPNIRGSGTHTSIAAYMLASLFKDDPIGAILTAANELGTYTDSIGTMTGALLGAVTLVAIPGEVQDLPYIDREATRLEAVAASRSASSFSYPHLLRWEPPQSQSDAIGLVAGKPALSGLGFVVERGAELRRAGKGTQNVWQWMTLDFGQSFLAKVRDPIPELSSSSAPVRRETVAAQTGRTTDGAEQLALSEKEGRSRETEAAQRLPAGLEEPAGPPRFWKVRRSADAAAHTERSAETECKSQGPLPDTEALAARIEASGF